MSCAPSFKVLWFLLDQFRKFTVKPAPGESRYAALLRVTNTVSGGRDDLRLHWREDDHLIYIGSDMELDEAIMVDGAPLETLRLYTYHNNPTHVLNHMVSDSCAASHFDELDAMRTGERMQSSGLLDNMSSRMSTMEDVKPLIPLSERPPSSISPPFPVVAVETVTTAGPEPIECPSVDTAGESTPLSSEASAGKQEMTGGEGSVSWRAAIEHTKENSRCSWSDSDSASPRKESPTSDVADARDVDQLNPSTGSETTDVDSNKDSSASPASPPPPAEPSVSSSGLEKTLLSLIEQTEVVAAPCERVPPSSVPSTAVASSVADQPEVSSHSDFVSSSAVTKPHIDQEATRLATAPAFQAPPPAVPSVLEVTPQDSAPAFAQRNDGFGRRNDGFDGFGRRSPVNTSSSSGAGPSPRPMSPPQILKSAENHVENQSSFASAPVSSFGSAPSPARARHSPVKQRKPRSPVSDYQPPSFGMGGFEDAPTGSFGGFGQFADSAGGGSGFGGGSRGGGGGFGGGGRGGAPLGGGFRGRGGRGGGGGYGGGGYNTRGGGNGFAQGQF